MPNYCNNNLEAIESETASIKEIHYCPGCHRPYLEEPEESGLFSGLMVCPQCKKLDKTLFSYWMNYKPFIEKQEVYDADDYTAFLINEKYTYLAYRSEGGWDYTLINEEGEILESGQLDEDEYSYYQAMTTILKEFNISAVKYEKVPWATANVLLELVYRYLM